MPYYSDLSGNSSDDGSESEASSSQEDSLVFSLHKKPMKKRDKNNNEPSEEDDMMCLQQQLSSCILHLDLDCFYCACEQIDRKLDKTRPFAIGQKHIIVTCNYEARRYGVKKLQSREGAYRACPSLLIVEGSDLERYRRHARNVYEVFRKCVQEECYDKLITSMDSFEEWERPIPPVCRGRGMDELQADISSLVDLFGKSSEKQGQQDIFIYGEGNQTTILTEDQTGQETTVKPYQAFRHQECNDDHQSQANCKNRLLLAAQELGRFIQARIFEKTGFTTSIGLSVNPLLAKIASDLQKPMSVNVLYPWRASGLMESMPLRKIPDAGHRTIKLLTPVLEKYHGRRSADSFWNCRDLLALPKLEVQQSLGSIGGVTCEILLQRCKGCDTSLIVDDQGGIPKTISVENSFRRGTVQTAKAVWSGLEDLYIRLPRLLKDRREWSKHPELAYPTTLRLTARTVDRNLLEDKQRRRPFVTKSKQIPFDGKGLLCEDNAERQQGIVREAVAPLVHSLVLSNSRDLNVTRLNIAVTNFRDVSEQGGSLKKGSAVKASSMTPDTTKPSPPVMERYCSQMNVSSRPTNMESFSTQSHKRLSSPSLPKQLTNSEVPCKRLKSNVSPPEGHTITACSRSVPKGIDPAVLAELPPDMVKEVVQDYKHLLLSKTSKATGSKKKAKSGRIDQFFSRK